LAILLFGGRIWAYGQSTSFGREYWEADSMKTILKAGASVAALLAFVVAAPGLSRAADMADPGCSLHGAVTLGYMFTGGDVSVTGFGVVDLDNTEWQTPFGEAAGLVTCDAWNFQADFADYAHNSSVDFGKDTIDIGSTEGHFGGAAFWRQPDMGTLGISASRTDQALEFINTDYWRVGAFGEFFVGDQFTLGASAHYFDGKDINAAGKDHKGFEITANAKFYVTPDLSLALQGDFMNGTLHNSGPNIDFDGWAIGSEAKYRVWDEGLSVLGGARYAERELSGSGESIKVKDMQAYVGIEFAFGAGGSSLVASDRSGPIDNTSVMFEKLPEFFSDVIAASPTGP
jgi:hypothetical protein